MFVGIDFPSLFEGDNFTIRRATGHNMYDPESLISGAEIAAGMTYTNSRRNWMSEQHYLNAAAGLIACESILRNAPRVLVNIPSLNLTQYVGRVAYPKHYDNFTEKR